MLSRSAALALGFTVDAIKHRSASGEWHRILPHTYLTRDTLLWDDKLAAALCFAGYGALLSGAAALDDLGLRSVIRPEQVLVLVGTDVHVRSASFVRVRRSARPVTPARRPGPARTAVARAAADLALDLRCRDDVRALLGDVIRRRLADPAELRAELEAGPRQFSAHLRDAVEEVSAGAWSAPEASAARILRAAGIDGFEQNVRIDLPGGGYFVADFLWRNLRAVLEIDGVEHHGFGVGRDATMHRHIALETLGYSVVHYTPAVVRWEPERFAQDVATWLAARRG